MNRFEYFKIMRFILYDRALNSNINNCSDSDVDTKSNSSDESLWIFISWLCDLLLIVKHVDVIIKLHLTVFEFIGM